MVGWPFTGFQQSVSSPSIYFPEELLIRFKNFSRTLPNIHDTEPFLRMQTYGPWRIGVQRIWKFFSKKDSHTQKTRERDVAAAYKKLLKPLKISDLYGWPVNHHTKSSKSP
jgi:hypothetical protein